MSIPHLAVTYGAEPLQRSFGTGVIVPFVETGDS